MPQQQEWWKRGTELQDGEHSWTTFDCYLTLNPVLSLLGNTTLKLHSSHHMAPIGRLWPLGQFPASVPSVK